MTCYRFAGLTPVVDPTAYVHPSAVLIGDVLVGPHCYIGPLASLRGDFGRIILEQGANLQDTCVMHGFPQTDTVIGRNGHVGHGAILHGCRIGADAMVGMNAVVMDEAQIGERSIVAACSFVKAGFACEPQSLVMGSPAKVTRLLRDDEVAWKQEGTREYQRLAQDCLQQMEACEPLCAAEADRPRLSGSSVKPKSAARA